MAKKKPVQQKKRTESEIERYVRKQFDEAGRFAKRKLGKSSAPMECDLTGNIVKRRRAAVLKYLDTVKERYEKRYPNVEVDKEFIVHNASLAPSPDVIDGERCITYAMAIAMLDQIAMAGEMPKVRPFFLHNNDEHRELSTLIPHAVDSCHESPVIRNMMYLILNRDPVDKDGKHYITEIAADRTEQRWEVDFDLDSSYPDDEAITARHRFNIAMSMIDEKARNQAMEKFEAKVWEFFDFYYQNLDSYLTRISEIEREREEYLSQYPAHAKLYEKIEKTAIAGGLVKPYQKDWKKEYAALNTVKVAQEYVKTFTFEEMQLMPQITDRVYMLDDEVSYQHECYWRLVDIGPFIPTLSFASQADYLNPEMANLWNKFTVEDPFEICLGYLCLLDSGSDIPWLYNASQAVLRAAIRKLPWFNLDIDLEFPKDDRDDPFGEGETEEHADNKVVIKDPLDDDETPENYEHVVRRDLYDLCYYGHSEDPFMNILDMVNLPQIVFCASGVIMPRHVWFGGDNIEYFLESGLNRDEAQFLELYSQLAMCMSDRTEDMESFLRSWQHDDFMTLYGLRDEPVDDADDQQAELKRLREELRKERAKSEKLQSQLYAAQKEADTAKKMAEQMTSETANEHRELLDLREVVFNQENDFEEAEETSVSGVEFPYKNKKRIVAFGGHDTWSKAIRPMLPDVVFVPRGQSPNAEMIRAADEIWIQANALAHKDYYKLMNIARPNHIPVRYFGYASAYKCAVQLAKSDMGDA